MKSAEQIIETLLVGIAQLYAAPQHRVWTRCGLDCVLFQLHWLYADATGRMDDFGTARMTIFKADLATWHQIHASADFHAVIDERWQFEPVIDEWKKLDELLGIRPEAAPDRFGQADAR